MEISILRYLDILIGLTVVMILLGTIVTAITQMVNAWTYSRARRLRSGLEVLITQVKADKLAHHARYLADAVVRHPMIGTKPSALGDFLTFWRNIFRRLQSAELPMLPYRNPGNVIEREELIRILLEFAADDGPCSPAANQAAPHSPHVQFGRTAAILSLATAAALLFWDPLAPSLGLASRPQWLMVAGYVLLTILYAALWRNSSLPEDAPWAHLRARIGRYLAFLALSVALAYASWPADKHQPIIGIWLLVPLIGLVVLIVSGFFKTKLINAHRQGFWARLKPHWIRIAGLAVVAVLFGLSARYLSNLPEVALICPLLVVIPAAIILAASPPSNWRETSNELDRAAQSALKEALDGLLKSPDGKESDLSAKEVLTNFRKELQELEKDKPEMAAHERQTKAILSAVKGDFVGKINSWYDQTMDRTTQQFTMEARLVTIGAALVVAVALQVDSLDLVRRLSVDDKFRQSLVDQAKSQQDKIEKREQRETDLKKACIEKAGKADTCTPPASDASDAELIKTKRDEIEGTLAELRQPALSIVPSHFLWDKVAQATVSPPAAPNQWPKELTMKLDAKAYLLTVSNSTTESEGDLIGLRSLEAAIRKSGAAVNTYLDVHKSELLIAARDTSTKVITVTSPANLPLTVKSSSNVDLQGFGRAAPGILFSWILLSLGAPFWYDLLKNSLNLRSTLARKEEKARDDRAKSEAPAPAASAAPQPGK